MRGTQNKLKPMKNLKFLASFLIMTLACVTFTSCSDDDKDEPGANVPSNIKHLVSLTATDADGNVTSITNVKYDSKNRVISFTLNEDNETSNYTYDYTSDITIKVDGEVYSTYNLKNGLIEKADYGYDEYYFFKYDNNRINTITYVYDTLDPWNFTYNWVNDNVRSVFSQIEDDSDSREYDYNNDKCITPIIYYTNLRCSPYSKFENEELFLFSEGYFGNSLTSNLIKTSEDDSVTEFEYQLDNDGYVTKMTVRSKYAYSSQTVNISWE